MTQVLDALLDDPGRSLRGLAQAVGVTPPTLRHYFGDREGAVIAALEHAGVGSGPALKRIEREERGQAPEALAWVLGELASLWPTISRLQRLALLHGLDHPRLGPVVVDRLLDPLIQALETRIATHMARGELASGPIRQAALALVSPLWVVMLHQESLGGARSHPIDHQCFAADHLAAFLRAYAPA